MSVPALCFLTKVYKNFTLPTKTQLTGQNKRWWQKQLQNEINCNTEITSFVPSIYSLDKLSWVKIPRQVICQLYTTHFPGWLISINNSHLGTTINDEQNTKKYKNSQKNKLTSNWSILYITIICYKKCKPELVWTSLWLGVFSFTGLQQQTSASFTVEKNERQRKA